MTTTCVFDGYDKTMPIEPLDNSCVEYTLDNVKFFGSYVENSITTAKEKQKNRYIKNRDHLLQYNRDYLKTPKGKMSKGKTHDYRRRHLGSEYLNEWFEGCERHHINNEQIICIPKELHRKYPHNHKKPETMIEINKLAFDYINNYKNT